MNTSQQSICFLALLENKDVKELLGLSRQQILDVLTQIRGQQRVTDPDPEGKYQVLETIHTKLYGTCEARKN